MKCFFELIFRHIYLGLFVWLPKHNDGIPLCCLPWETPWSFGFTLFSVYCERPPPKDPHDIFTAYIWCLHFKIMKMCICKVIYNMYRKRLYNNIRFRWIIIIWWFKLPLFYRSLNFSRSLGLSPYLHFFVFLFFVSLKKTVNF